MHYREVAPRSELKPYIKCFWILEDPLSLASNGEITYTPYINGVQAPDFRFNPTLSHNNQTSQRAVFVNEANDFPKRISYEKSCTSPEMINIRLEGQGQDGKELVIEFPMFTADCNTNR